MINVQVEKNPNESNTSILRRFMTRVRESGVLPRVRSLRYHGRAPSDFLKKKQTLKAQAKREYVQMMIKLGKMSEKTTRTTRRR